LFTASILGALLHQEAVEAV
jgi:hypothetical protein